MKPKNQKRRKFTYKSKILGSFAILLLLIVACVVSPLFTPKATSKVTEVLTNPLGNEASLDVVSRKYNPKTRLYMEQFLVNPANESDTDTDVTDLSTDVLKDLDNLKWSAKIAFQSGDDSNMRVKIYETDQRMITVYAQNVPAHFGAIRFDWTLHRESNLLKSNMVPKHSTLLRYYSLQARTPNDSKLQVASGNDLHNQLISYEIERYTKAIKSLTGQTRSAKADIKQNKKLARSLQSDLDDETSTSRTDTQNKIDEYRQATETDQSQVTQNNTKTRELKKQVQLLKDQLK